MMSFALGKCRSLPPWPNQPSIKSARAATSSAVGCPHHVVLGVLENIAWNFGAANHHHHWTVATNPRNDLSVGFTVHGEMNRNAGLTVASILLGEALEPPHGPRKMLACHLAAKSLVDGSDVLEQIGPHHRRA